MKGLQEVFSDWLLLDSNHDHGFYDCLTVDVTSVNTCVDLCYPEKFLEGLEGLQGELKDREQDLVNTVC